MEEKTTFVYTGMDEGFDTADAVAQNPGLIEILEVGEIANVTIGMSLDRFLNFRETEKRRLRKGE